jgi:hypothetical protein
MADRYTPPPKVFRGLHILLPRVAPVEQAFAAGDYTPSPDEEPVGPVEESVEGGPGARAATGGKVPSAMAALRETGERMRLDEAVVREWPSG